MRGRLTAERSAVRQAEEALAARAQQLRSLEGERTALEQEIAGLRERAAEAEAHVARLRDGSRARRDGGPRGRREGRSSGERWPSLRPADMERSRHAVAEGREQEMTERNRRRLAGESLAQLTTRRAALEELERDRVGLAPGAATLLAARERFDGGVLGPLSDYISADRDAAELAERLLGDWMHAILVRDQGAVDAIRHWHAESQPGALVLLPAGQRTPDPGDGASPLQAHLQRRRPRVAVGRRAAGGLGSARRTWPRTAPCQRRHSPGRRRVVGSGRYGAAPRSAGSPARSSSRTRSSAACARRSLRPRLAWWSWSGRPLRRPATPTGSANPPAGCRAAGGYRARGAAT